MSDMNSESMIHIAPLPSGRIANAPPDQGGTPLKGAVRNDVLESTLDARPVWWRIHGKQRLAAYAYNSSSRATRSRSSDVAVALGRRASYMSAHPSTWAQLDSAPGTYDRRSFT